MFILLLLVGAVLPLAITPGLLFHFDISPKTIALGMAATVALLRIRAIRVELADLWTRRSGRWLLFIAALQVIWAGIVTATSMRPALSVAGSNWRQFGLVTIVLVLVVIVLITADLCRHPRNTELLLRMIAVAGVLASLYGIAQFFDIDPFQSSVSYQARAGDSVIVRPPGTLGHADYFAWWLAIETFCGIALAARNAGAWRVIGIACAVCAAFATLLTGTRAAYVAILAGVIVLVLLTQFRLKRKHATAAIVAIAMLAAFYFSPAGARLRARAVWSGEEPAGGARPLLWRDSLRMAGSRPVFGFGPETFQSAFGPWQSEELARLYPDFHHESPHNIALDALTSGGIPGLLLLIAWGVLVVRSGTRSLKLQPATAAPLIAALVASFTASMFDAAALGPVVLSLLVIGLIVSLEAVSVDAAEHPAGPAIPMWMLSAVCVISAAGACAFAGATAIADYTLAAFQRSPSKAASEAVLRWELPATAEDIYLSRVLLNQCQPLTAIGARLECWRVAEQVGARATGTAGDPANAWYNLAQFTAAQNDVKGTKMALDRAVDAAPNWFKPHWTLARLLSQTGQSKEAVAEGERAAVLNSNHDTEVAETLRQIRAIPPFGKPATP